MQIGFFCVQCREKVDVVISDTGMCIHCSDKGYQVGDKVEKVGGDYTFVGVVVSSFNKLSGVRRYVVEDDRGVLHVYSDKNLRPS